MVSDTMVSSYVLDPGRRSGQGLELLAFEFLDHTMTSYEDLCGKGRRFHWIVRPGRVCSDYSCEDVDVTWQLERRFGHNSRQQIYELYRDIDPLIGVLADMEWTGVEIDRSWFASLK